MSTPVSIIITARNYGKYLPKSLDSALNQSYSAVEVVVVNDGSSDQTAEVLSSYAGRPNLKIITTDGIGLAAACNRGIAESTGDYIVRLDADDWFDDNLVLVEATFLDRQPNVGLVFCDFHTVNMHGEIIDHVRRAKVNDEIELLDRPALAAGAMYRRKCYAAIGGYNETLRYQEDYDFWIKFIERFEVRNISLPLMYYRQHSNSMSRNHVARMATRRQVKMRFVDENRERFKTSVMAVIAARGDRLDGRKFPLLPVAEASLLERCIKKIKGAEIVERVIVSTEDAEIAAEAERFGAEVPYLRSAASVNVSMPFETAMRDLLLWLGQNQNYRPDLVVICHPHSPFIRTEHVVEAIDTLLLYRTDAVIAVTEDLTYHWQLGKQGLTPVGYQKRVVRQDKDIIFKETGGLYVFRSESFLTTGQLLGSVIGHIELLPHEAVRIQTPFDYWLAQQMVSQGSAGPWV